MENPFEVLQKQIANLETMVSQLLTRSAAKTDGPERFITLDEAAQLLMLTKIAIYKNIDSIPHRKRHGQHYFFASELIDYVNQGQDVFRKKSIIKPRQTRRKVGSSAE